MQHLPRRHAPHTNAAELQPGFAPECADALLREVPVLAGSRRITAVHPAPAWTARSCGLALLEWILSAPSVRSTVATNTCAGGVRVPEEKLSAPGQERCPMTLPRPAQSGIPPINVGICADLPGKFAFKKGGGGGLRHATRLRRASGAGACKHAEVGGGFWAARAVRAVRGAMRSVANPCWRKFITSPFRRRREPRAPFTF